MGTALITGASSGIGEAFAKQLAFFANDLIIVARREERLNHLAENLSSEHSIKVEVLVADLTKDEDIERVAQTIQECDDLTMLVNNAGFNVNGRFADVALEQTLDIVRLHIETTMRLCHAVLPNMRKRQQGTIINLASIGGFLPMPSSVVYNATKAFLVSFSDSLAYEEAENGIIVQTLCPGFTRTEIFETSGASEEYTALIPDIAWMSSEEVVSISLAALAKKRYVVTPGIINQLTRRILTFPLFAHWLKLYTLSFTKRKT
jgi:uncharacterized protein